MGITKPGESPAMIAHLIHHHHPGASWRLELVAQLAHQLAKDAKREGFPNAAAALELAAAAAADVTSVGAALDRSLASPGGIARMTATMLAVEGCSAEPAPEAREDATIDTSRTRIATARLNSIADELDQEGRQQ